jgi:uncharacterized protein YbjT (DUF2867 family)
MHLILGGTGHVGSAVARALIQRSQPVTILTRDGESSTAKELHRQGAEVVRADIHDIETMRLVFRKAKRLFLLNPPADPSTDTDTEERKSLKSILTALPGSGLEKIVAESTYGAQPAPRLGDLGTLYDMEQDLKAQPIPFSLLRAAYYMSNWDASLQTAKKDGVLHSFFPRDFSLPMVAPRDIGNVASRLLTEPVSSTGLHYVEGPERYTINDVADAFSRALNQPIDVVVIPRDRWIQAYKELGFSDAAAASYSAMTAATLDDDISLPESPERGNTSLREYVFDLVRRDRSKAG